MASKLFGGLNLSDVAKQIKEKGDPSPYENSPTRPVVPAAELALTGRTSPMAERTNIFSVDPKRCRPWKYHNRSTAWYTKERCQDLIDSIVKDGQLEPALARKVSGDPDFDFELIYGMRRRFAAEFTHSKLKVRVTDADDAKAAVLMHIENADRQDITAMERALSFQQQLEAKIFSTQDAMAEAFGLSKGQVTKLLKAAQLLKQTTIGQLFVDKSAVPVEAAYQLSVLMDRPGAKEGGAKSIGKRGEGADAGGDVEGVDGELGSVAACGADEAGVSRGSVDADDGGAEPEGEGDTGLSEGVATGRSRGAARGD